MLSWMMCWVLNYYCILTSQQFPPPLHRRRSQRLMAWSAQILFHTDTWHPTVCACPEVTVATHVRPDMMFHRRSPVFFVWLQGSGMKTSLHYAQVRLPHIKYDLVNTWRHHCSMRRYVCLIWIINSSTHAERMYTVGTVYPEYSRIKWWRFQLH
jgi:hypothetical protein